MKVCFVSLLISGFVATAIGQQQQSPFAPPAVNEPNTPANQGVATNPTGAASNPTQPGVSPIDNTAGAFGGMITNPSASAVFGQAPTNPAIAGTAPLFLNLLPTTITDANGVPIGILQQLVLSPSGVVTFGIVNISGRLVPVPFQLIVSGTTRGTLAVTNRAIIRTAPPVEVSQLPLLTQDDVQAGILGHFGLQPRTQPIIIDTGTARGRRSGPGVTITGGSTNNGAFGSPTTGTNIFGASTESKAFNTNTIPNNTRANQAVNTTSGLLSPTGRTNAAFDGYNSGQPMPVPAPPPNPAGQPR